MTASAPTAVLFDIDGTLIDSNYLHVDAWGRALAEVGFTVDSWRIHRCIGMDSAKLLETLIGVDEHELASELHEQYYAEGADRLRAFDGARELIRELAARGLTVVRATSAPEDELATLRGILDVEDAIAVVTSSGDVEQAKPAPDIVHVALERSGVEASDAVFAGDTRWDVEASGRAGVPCIGVRSGGIDTAELTDAGAVAV